MSLLGWEFAVLLFVTLLAYFCLGLIKVKRKNGSVFVFPSWTALLVASLVFFGFSNWVCLIYILVSSAVSYLAGLLAQRKLVYTYNTSENSTSFTFVKALGHVKDGSRKGRISLILSILVNVVILVVLNYFNFFSESVASIFKIDPVIYDFIVPIGLSFYTFTLIAYNVDCYRRTYECETNFFKFLLFVSYFPRVLQGPISSIQRLREDGFYENHSFSEVDFRSSFGRLGLGLFKKVFIADILGVYVDYIWNNQSSVGAGWLWLGVLFYAIQLYCDFSGFIDMGIGISRLFGINLEENFDTPYESKSVSEFCRRWHSTLGRWFRNYVYIPLGGLGFLGIESSLIR